MLITKRLPPSVIPTVEEEILYPESDGKPMADNSKQFRYLTMIEGNLEILFADDMNVFVIGDMLWYPVEGHPEIRQAPDIMVAFERPKGDRGSYLQWREANIAPQVVFEILSPGNRRQEMENKFHFYNQYGVEEYYVYDPDRGRLRGWLRANQGGLTPIPDMIGWRSPRLGVRFAMAGIELQLFYPDGERFLGIIELNVLRKEAELRADKALDRLEVAMENLRSAMDAAATAQSVAKAEAQRAEAETQRAETEAKRAEAEAQRAETEANAHAGPKRACESWKKSCARPACYKRHFLKRGLLWHGGGQLRRRLCPLGSCCGPRPLALILKSYTSRR